LTESKYSAQNVRRIMHSADAAAGDMTDIGAESPFAGRAGGVGERTHVDNLVCT
jgi:hypothetical protein